MSRNRTLAILATALIVTLGVACTTSDAAPEGTPTGTTSPPATASPTNTAGTPGGATSTPDDATDDLPPAVTLTTTDGTSAVMRLGTYCWTMMCVDAIGILTHPEPLAATPGAELTLGGDAFADDLLGTNLQLWPVPAATVAEGDDWLAWRPETEPITLELIDGAAALPADLEAGTYLAALFLNFAAGGDASYGLLIEIAP